MSDCTIDVAVAITTAPRRVPTLSDTLASVAAAGWPSPAVINDPDSDGPWPTWRRALVSLRMRALMCDLLPRWYLIFQDDVAVTAGLRDWWQDNPPPEDAICSLFLPAAVRLGGDGWCRQRLCRARSYGAQGILVPAGLCDRLCTTFPNPGARTMVDFWLAIWCRNQGVPWAMHSPSLVRHTGLISSLQQPCENSGWRQCANWLPAIGSETVRCHRENA